MHRIRPLITVESPECATHDTSRVPHHVQDIKEFFETVERAARSAFPNSRKSRYQAVHVLLLSWVEDDLGVVVELDRLTKVFKDLYGFNTEKWLIPSEDSHGELNDTLRAFTKTHAREDALLIVYYGGHGFLNDHRQPIWLCNQKDGAPSVKWFAHQVTLEEVKSDVLVLLDCCSAGGFGGDTTKGTKEVIAACGFETWAPGVGDHSFTKSVIEELKYLSTGPSFSVSSLHSRVLDRLKHWNPIYDAERLLMQGSDGRYQDRERRKTPVYISLNKERSTKSIEIVPRLGTRNEGRAERNASAGTPTDDRDETLVAMTDFMKDDRYKHVEVTLSIQVETGQILSPDDMVDWIKELPLLAKSVRLQAVIPSMSTLLVFSLPVATWNLLPSNPACSFVGFTTSTNLLLSNYDEKVPGWLDRMADKPTSAPSLTSHGLESENKGCHNTTTLHEAVQARVDARKPLLLSKKVNTEAKDHKNRTALHYAAKYESSLVVQQLLAKGANLNAKDHKNRTALHYAVEYGRSDVVQQLLTSGANIEAKDHKNRTALHYAVEYARTAVAQQLSKNETNVEVKNEYGSISLHDAARGAFLKEDESLVRLLLINGADIEAKDHNGQTALHLAIGKGSEKENARIVQRLLSFGADINARDYNEQTALHVAVEKETKNGNETIVQQLLDSGANINAKDDNGQTPLHVTVGKGNRKEKETIVQQLLDFGADIDARDYNGKTALH